MKEYALIMLAVVAGGCASPPSAFHHDDFAWETMTDAAPPLVVYERIAEGGRRCTNLNHYRNVGRLEGDVALFDVFLPSPIIDSNYVAGRIEITKYGDTGSLIKMGMLRKYYRSADSSGFFPQIRGYVEQKSACW